MFRPLIFIITYEKCEKEDRQISWIVIAVKVVQYHSLNFIYYNHTVVRKRTSHMP